MCAYYLKLHRGYDKLKLDNKTNEYNNSHTCCERCNLFGFPSISWLTKKNWLNVYLRNKNRKGRNLYVRLEMVVPSFPTLLSNPFGQWLCNLGPFLQSKNFHQLYKSTTKPINSISLIISNCFSPLKMKWIESKEKFPIN